MTNNYEKSAFVSVNRLKIMNITLATFFFVVVLFLVAPKNLNATNYNVGTISSNTTWSGTTSGNTCSTRPSYDNQYQFVAGFTGTYTFSTCNVASWDTYFYLSTGSCGSGTITSNDDYCGLQSTVSANLTAGVTYYLLIEGWSTSSYGSYSISVTSPCNPSGDQSTYGNGSWIGYTYTSASTGAFSSYIGYVTESETFNRTHSGPLGATTNLSCSNPTDLFAIRYKMNKNFTAGLYTFTIGGDDGIRLSVNGGSTWLINGWATQSYTTYTASVYLSGSTNLVIEYYENTGVAQTSFNYTLSSEMVVASTGSNTYTACSGTLYDAGGSAGNYNNSWNGYTVLYPATTGAKMQISGSTSGASCCDYIYVYDGTSTSATLLGSYLANYGTIPAITATNSQGALTVKFVSDASSVGSGFALNLNCVIPAPATPANPTSNSPYCSNVTISRTGSAPAGEVWYWQTTSTGTSTTYSGATYSVSSTGTYYIRSRRTSDGVWGAAASINVIVDQMPTAVNAGSNSQICQSSSVQLSGSANGSNLTYTWTPSTGLSNANIYNPVASPSSTTTYTMTANSGTCQSSDDVVITVNPLMPVSVSIISDATLNTTCAGNSTVFTATPVNGVNEEYQWKLNGNDIGSNSNTFTAANLTNGDQISVVLSSDINCATSNPATSNTITMTIQAPVIPYIANGDYIWTGKTNSDWSNSTNWIVFDGTTYGQAITAPDNTNNVFFKSFYSCVSNEAFTPAFSEISCNNISIETGLTLGNISTLNVAGDWNNSGNFEAGSGIVRFNGSEKQIINSGASSFNNVTFTNTSNGTENIELTSPMTINGEAIFTDGIVYFSGTGSLSFGSSALAAVSSNNSFVNGIVTKTGSTPFVLPIGDVNTRDLDGNGDVQYIVLGAIAISPSASASVTAEYFYSDENNMPDWWEHGGNMDASIHHVSNREHWVVNADQNMDNITLYWYDNGHANGDICVHGFDNGIPADFVASDLAVAYWTGSLWRNAGGITSGNHDEGNIASELTIPFGFKAPTYITFGSKHNLNPLPVELTSFAANCNDGNTVIEWTTASEINNDYFLVQVSNDMQDFTTIQKVFGAGNSSVINNYSIEYLSNGSSAYYRLVQVDYDGTEKIYSPVYVECNGSVSSPELNAYPNPFNNEISFVLNNYTEQTAKIQIIDKLGKIVFETETEVNSLYSEHSFNLESLKSSIYTVRIIGESTVLNQQIVKQ